MKGDQTQSETQKYCILSFPYRRTGMGGFDDTLILSLRKGKIIGSILRKSRTGNHGTRIYKVLPAKYLIYSVSRSNGGHIYAKVGIVRVDDECSIVSINEWLMNTVKDEVLKLDDLPREIRDLLALNKDSLPLWGNVFPFDTDQGNAEQEG